MYQSWNCSLVHSNLWSQCRKPGLLNKTLKSAFGVVMTATCGLMYPKILSGKSVKVSGYKCSILKAKRRIFNYILLMKNSNTEKIMIDPLLCTETPNVVHMQHYLSQNKNSSESKEQPSAKILATYQVKLAIRNKIILFTSFSYYKITRK